MGRHYHLVGIGGIGLSGVAKILLEMGYKVTGSDIGKNGLISRLCQKGATIYKGHAKENIKGADFLVVSSAVPPDNPEVEEAKKLGIPILHRAQMLARIMESHRGIAISGTHGKTTTSSMVATLLEYVGLDPTVAIGGEMHSIGSNARLGKGGIMVVEADESDASFLFLKPQWVVVTSIGVDVNLNVAPYSHLNFDYKRTLERVSDAFLRFINNLPHNGSSILCYDDENIKNIIPKVSSSYLTYGLKDGADIQAREIKLRNFGSQSLVYYKGKLLGELHLKVPGKYNIKNALATVAIGLELGISFDRIREALYQYRGVKRRFEKIGEVKGVLVVDDYAHNPEKVQSLLAGAKTGGRNRVIAVFQPHRFTRTKFLFDEFVVSFSDADVLVLTEIYSAHECPIVGVKGENLAKAIEKSPYRPKEVYYIPHLEDIVTFLEGFVQSGDIVVTCGAGNIYKVAYELVKRLEENVACQKAAV